MMNQKIICDKEDLEVIAEAVRESLGSSNTYNVPNLSSAAARIIKNGGGASLPVGDAPYRQLVTDSEGNTIWEDRTHYVEKINAALLEETNLVYNNNFGLFAVVDPIITQPTLETIYTIVWNGVHYQCPCITIEYSGVVGYGFGNTSAYGGESTDDPFGIFIMPSDMVESFNISALVLPLDGSNAITLAIYGEYEIVHKLDNKFVEIQNSFIKNGKAYGSLRTIESIPEDENYSLGGSAFAVGLRTKASGLSSYAEGYESVSSGLSSHAEGCETTASSIGAHAEGSITVASGDGSHAEGRQTVASGNFSHSEGEHTIALGPYQHVQGKSNIEDSNKYAHIVGNGSNPNQRSNAHTLDWQGNAWFQGDVYVGSTGGVNRDDGSQKLATEQYVDDKIMAIAEEDAIELLLEMNMLPTLIDADGKILIDDDSEAIMLG